MATKLVVQGLDEIAIGFQKAPALFRQERQAGLQGIIDHVVPRIKSHTPVARGLLKKEIGGHLEDGGATAVIDGGAIAPVVVMSIEKGAVPHWPPWGPESAVAAWALMKGIPAFLVAHSIAQKGTKGHFMFQKGLEESQAFISTESKRIVARIAKRLFKRGG